MARPKDVRFFEVPLPENLPPNLEWLRLYHEHSAQLSQYLTDRGAKSTAYHAAIRYLTEFRHHLVESGSEYTPEAAISWFEKSGFHDKGTKVTIFRLSDLYQYGSVQPPNAFPVAIPYRNELHEPWKTILDGYISSLSNKDCWNEAIRSHLARFLYRIQTKGVQNPEEITFELLEEYLQNDFHVSKSSTSKYTHAICGFLHFMAEKNMCGHGLGWYPYYRMQNRVVHISDLTANQIERLEAARIESMDFPSEEFAAVIPDFLHRISILGYSKTPRKTASYTLQNLLLFLEMNGLGYHPVIAAVWLENEHKRINSSGWKQSRRILNLFEVYTVEGDVIPQLIFREKPLLSDGLPIWCKIKLDAFLLQKTREGWESSTLCMYRSSVTRFCLFLCAEGFTSFSEVDATSISAFNRADKHLSAEGKNAYNVKIRSFLQFLERNQDIPYGLHMALYCTAANREKFVVTLTDEEVNEIRDSQTEYTTPMQLRHRAIVLLGTKMGIRASDIVEIKLQDINWEKQTIGFIQEKTSHEVNLPMPTVVGNAIFLYLTKGRPQTESEYLFVKHRVPFDSLNRVACLKALKTMLPNRNVPRSGFHVTRKTYATEKLRKGATRQKISELLGQKDTSSLHHYLYLDSERMRQCPLTLEDVNLGMEGNRYGI